MMAEHDVTCSLSHTRYVWDNTVMENTEAIAALAQPKGVGGS